MELSVMSPVLNRMRVEEAIQYLSRMGVNSIEMGVGGYPGKAHVDAEDFLTHPEKTKNLKNILEKYNMKLSAVACHGNPVHPVKEIAKGYHDDFVAAMKLAAELGVDTIIGFSGCPGDCESSKNPNWVTCAWPNEYLQILEYQWNEVLIPYWKEAAKLANEIGIRKIAIEMHPGFCVYNPKTLLKLRKAAGPIIGANVDPSHLFWQGIDPCEAIRELEDCVYHFHAKDTKMEPYKIALNGVLDTEAYTNISERSWVFRTVGYGHGAEMWRQIISSLKMIGYDGAISIEHEDGLMSPREGLEKAIAFLKEILIYEKAEEMWWV